VTSEGGPPLRTIGLIVGGAGIVGLGLGGFFALRASSLNSDSKASNHCDSNNQCDPTGLGLRDDAISAANIATVATIAGGVLAATGVTLFIVGAPKDARADSARVQATPAVGPGVAGMMLGGRF
jgi:serine/threonine-protein kinase